VLVNLELSLRLVRESANSAKSAEPDHYSHKVDLDLVLYVGGRFHFNDSVSLTMRRLAGCALRRRVVFPLSRRSVCALLGRMLVSRGVRA
jgi:hypothetical protein